MQELLLPRTQLGDRAGDLLLAAGQLVHALSQAGERGRYLLELLQLLLMRLGQRLVDEANAELDAASGKRSIFSAQGAYRRRTERRLTAQPNTCSPASEDDRRE